LPSNKNCQYAPALSPSIYGHIERNGVMPVPRRSDGVRVGPV